MIIIGDFNLSEFDWTTNQPTKYSEHHVLLSDIIQDNFLQQLVDKSTRENNTLDLVLTTNIDLISDLEVGEPFSGHNQITFNVNISPYQNRVSKKEVYAFSKADWSYLRALFDKSPWELTITDEDINKNWESCKDIFFAAVNDCVPKYSQRRKVNAPWISKELIKLCRKKRNLYKRPKIPNCVEHWEAYKKLNNSLKRKCNLARRKYLEDLASTLKTENNPKPFWNYVKCLRKGTNNLVFLKEDNKEVTSDRDIAEHMNEYFSTVFTLEQNTLPEYNYATSEK